MILAAMNGLGVGASAAGTGVGAGGGARGLEEDLSLPILLAERVRKAAGEAESFRSECAELGRQADLLADMLRAVVRRLSSLNSPLYDRPVRRVATEAAKNLDRALSLARRCHRSGPLRRLLTTLTSSAAADFRKASAGLDASLGDLKWLLSVYADDDAGNGAAGLALTLPPIASTDPILSWVWSLLAAVHFPSADRAEAALSLAGLASDSHRNKKIIAEEGGTGPLLALLRDPAAPLDARANAASALANLALGGRDLVSTMVADLAVPVVVGVLSDAPIKLQSRVATLISRMATADSIAQEEFARENAIRPLVSILAFDVPLDETAAAPAPRRPTSIHSLVRLNRDSGGDQHSYYYHPHQHQRRKEWESESPEAKVELKVACAEALWMLSRGCLSNSRKITETKGLLCLAKLVEREKGELQFNCLMAVMEIAAAAESDADLRRSAFKINSPAAKSVVEQLQRVVQQENRPSLQIPAIKAIGSLARTFPARETRVLGPLVAQLGHWNPDVAAEAAMALGKFASPENFLCVEHSKAIVEFGGVPPLMRLLRPGEKTQLPGLVLLCYLALHVPSNAALERAKALGTLESVSRGPVAQHASLKELLPKAIYQLELFRAGAHTAIDIDSNAL